MSVLWKKPIMEHLIWYKEHVIGCTGSGEWNNQPYRHIFPPNQTHLNFFDKKPPENAWLKVEGHQRSERIIREASYDHMNSAWVMGLNLFPKLFSTEEAEAALLCSLRFQGLPFLNGRSIRSARFEEPLAGDFADICLTLDDGSRLLIQLFYYNFSFGEEIPRLFTAAQGNTHCVFVLLRQNTLLNPDQYLQSLIQQQDNRDKLHTLYWEEWLPLLISLLSGDAREYAKELFRKNLDF